MSKKVMWKKPDMTPTPAQPGQFRSFKEFMAKSEAIRIEQEKAHESLQKAMSPMLELLKLRLQKGAPLIVMRPLNYTTSDVAGAGSEMDEIEKSYYNSRSEDSNKEVSFENVTRTILPGTQLVLKSLSQTMREFYFQDATGKEYEISFDERNQLLTQTDIYETALKYLNTQGDK